MDIENSLNFQKKIARKQKRCQRIVEKEIGIFTCLTSTKNIVIANAGLANGLSEENLLESFLPYGIIEKIVLLPGKSCAVVCFKEVSSAENAYKAINGKLNIAQDSKPLYLLFSEKIPETEDIKKRVPPGLIILKDFVTEEEESILLNCINWDGVDCGTLKHRKVKHYGFEFRYDINNVDKNEPLEHGIPRECDAILDRFRAKNKQFKYFTPDQLTINEYQPGQGIPPHVDTHSAFENPLLSLSLGSSVNMEFRNNNGEQVSILLPRRSLLIISDESRYAWTHGITSRKLDIIPTDQGLTVQERGLRTSFTFRKVLKGECDCKYVDNCDSYSRLKTHIESDLAEELEATHVHKVYEEIASHFSNTRHKPWPNVLEFINSFDIGSILVDVGCGNGKYLGCNNDIFEIGCDRSVNLTEICFTRGFQVFTCNCLNIPIKNTIADGAISIAVIHHLANESRRLQAIVEIVRVLKIGGRALIYVWAKDQKKENKSTYLKQDRKNRKESSSAEDTSGFVVNIGSDVSLPVHKNRTQFQSKDVLVPWKLKQNQVVEVVETDSTKTFLRYYHVFDEGELENLCTKLMNVIVIKSFYDEGNWCIIIEKI